MQLPIFSRLAHSRSVLLAGCGGGYDVASAIPLWHYLRAQGKAVVFANLSFTQLDFTDCAQPSPGCYRIDDTPAPMPYFPEKHLYDWLKQQGETAPQIYAYSNRLGVQPLRAAYRYLREEHRLDTLILVDGGTDSLMRGDETGVGTLVEDSLSVIAAAGADYPAAYLSINAFGIEQGLDHYPLLHNIAELTALGAYLGSHSLSAEMPEGAAYLDLIHTLNERLPSHKSIINNAIASAMRGAFGDHHSSARTRGSEQFINPLMPLYWYFDLNAVAARLIFRAAVETSQNMDEYLAAYLAARAAQPRRTERRDLPI